MEESVQYVNIKKYQLPDYEGWLCDLRPTESWVLELIQYTLPLRVFCVYCKELFSTIARTTYLKCCISSHQRTYSVHASYLSTISTFRTESSVHFLETKNTPPRGGIMTTSLMI